MSVSTRNSRSTRNSPQHRARPLRRRLVAAVSGIAAAVSLGAFGIVTHQATATPAGSSATPAASEADEQVGPPQKTFAEATAYALTHPAAVPTGANDWACTPSAEHPRPVVLVHGTFENRYMNWAGLAPKLKDAGYCVYALNYGGKEGGLLQGIGDMAESAAQLSAFVDKVRERTGSSRVDLVGHSQGGGVMPRHYIKNLGGAAKVDKLVALSPNNHGTTLSGLATLAKAIPGAGDLTGAACPACMQQTTGSDFVTALKEGGETDPAVDYSVLATRTDWVVTPYTSSYLADADNVTQSKLQDHCPLDLTEHLGLSYNKTATRFVLNALDPAHAEKLTC
ncbi:alpha/beta fold hydrolase [Streptomyces sp. MZ04]|uniref:esterase/lipase family protein n=1 Tax=Streptomyces sp. MZ04 TaxID=2559236 RepID=UPI00107ECC17|nr:alpha/beta fold hydrolase [Streptomyces sp. MZ04]TGB01145.1 alpha/beta fold hydrolase [Streptomyces sp. MZ04]